MTAPQPTWQCTQFPPYNASSWGEDRYGRFYDLEFRGALQRMRWIPPGEFNMGSESELALMSEHPVRRVTLTRGFWLADTPCTQELWQAVMGENPSNFHEGGAKRPVENVSWDDCQKFLERLGASVDGLSFRLPTEAQWEYACRAESEREWCFGSDEAQLHEFAWYAANSGQETHPVGALKRNDWGLADMHGNVWEWCQDYWQGNYKGAVRIDPTGPSSGDFRVVRGGGWFDFALLCRSACRNGYRPVDRSYFLGFRFAQVGGAE